MSARSVPLQLNIRRAMAVLSAAALVAAVSVAMSVDARADVNPHVNTSVAAGDTARSWGNVTKCADCHRAHTAQGANLTTGQTTSQIRSSTTSLCLTCHDGTGAGVDVSGDWGSSVPKNDELTRSYYRHEVALATKHSLASKDEFAGVLNRHSECTDCHNPHDATATASTGTPDGTAWTASGRILGTSGVRVTNGDAGSAPSYEFLDGTSARMTFEYQLCMKCHSGYTTLLDNVPDKPSLAMLDAGVEFNPANASFHPVEGPGRNASDAMAASLAGGSTYKLWNLKTSSTIRCTQCHASAIDNPAGSSLTAGSTLSSHSSTFRGILTQKYEDRTLLPASTSGAAAGFDESNFALCFLCHTDSPFIGASGGAAATNFPLHRLHMAQISNKSDSGQDYVDKDAGMRDIDTAGDGRGNALCAECHFRPHSTATTATPTYSGLVSFAPDVTANSGTQQISWTSNVPGTGSCALTCHGHVHDPAAAIPTGVYGP